METDLIGYAARFYANDNLEKLTYVSKPDSVSELIGNDNYSVNLHTLYGILFLLILFALPLFTVIFISFTYIECTEKSASSNSTNQPAAAITDPATDDELVQDPSDQTTLTSTNSTSRLNSASDLAHQLTAAISHSATEAPNDTITSASSISSSESSALLNPPVTPATGTSDPSSMSNPNLKYMMYSFVATCMLGSITMVYFQRKVITGKHEWFYCFPYLSLWMSMAVYLCISVVIVRRVEVNNRLTKSKAAWLEGIFLWIVSTTMQLLSWHLVFVVYGFILNPLRALLCSLTIILAVVCCTVSLAVIIKTFCTIYKTYKRNGASNDSPNDSVINNTSHCFHIAVMSSIIMLLICAIAYIVFIYQISITVNDLTIEDITKSIILSAFMMIFTWLLPKIYLDPTTLLKYVKKKGAYGDTRSN